MIGATSINIAILAMGGEGGGVLADWLVRIGESNGYLAQTTSVPGVSQRTGATIYYLELFPKSVLDAQGRMPVLGLMPMPGDVDLLVASELMEAGRAIQRGLVTPDRTHLVASTHRVYSMTERTAPADGRVDAQAILKACDSAARKFTGFDMASLAQANRSVISAALLGAVAGSQALPFPREDYEAAIQADGVGVSASLAAFAAAYAAAAQNGTANASAGERSEAPAGATDLPLPAGLSGEARMVAALGARRAADYQDDTYARDYLARLGPFIELTKSKGAVGQELLAEVARQLALGMTYEDTVRVAELKVRATRFDRVRTDVGANSGQIVEIAEFMHPRLAEIADTMPAPLGRWMLRSRLARAFVTRLTSRGRIIRTTSLRGFLLLYCVASLKPFRRRTLRHDREMRFVMEWLDLVREAAAVDVPLAIGFARLRNLVRGYGDTCERGLAKYQAIRAFMSGEPRHSSASTILDGLIAAAEKDEAGAALDTEMDRLRGTAGDDRSPSGQPALQAG